MILILFYCLFHVPGHTDADLLPHYTKQSGVNVDLNKDHTADSHSDEQKVCAEYINSACIIYVVQCVRTELVA